MPLPLLPDVVDLAITGLAAQPSITALVSSRVYSRIPGTPTWPLLVVSTVDEGEAGDPGLGESRVQVDCWGAGNGPGYDQQARLLARTVRAVARDLVGSYVGKGSITGCAPGLIVPAPDGDTGRARFIVDLLLTTIG
jgi:hypothetical protein